MSTGLSKLSKFRLGQDHLSVYLKHFKMYVQANGMKGENKIPLSLTMIVPIVYNVFNDLFAPDSPITKVFDELTDKLKMHFKPKAVNILAHRHSFHHHSQGHNESIANCMAKLRHLASNCSFGTFLEQALLDHLVFMIYSKANRKQLLTQSDIALSKVIQLVLSMEAAQKDSKALKSSIPQVHRVTSYKPCRKEQREKACYSCGNANHTSACSFCEVMCHVCAQHLRHLEEVLWWLHENGMQLHWNKCHFIHPTVEYWGRHIDAERVHTPDSKVKAIVKAPIPRNVSELHSFLGLSELLWEVSPQSSISTTPSSSITSSWYSVDVDQRV